VSTIVKTCRTQRYEVDGYTPECGYGWWIFPQGELAFVCHEGFDNDHWLHRRARSLKCRSSPPGRRKWAAAVEHRQRIALRRCYSSETTAIGAQLCQCSRRRGRSANAYGRLGLASTAWFERYLQQLSRRNAHQNHLEWVRSATTLSSLIGPSLADCKNKPRRPWGRRTEKCSRRQGGLGSGEHAVRSELW